MDLKARHTVNFPFLILFLLCLQFNNSTLLSFNEGDDAEIVFQYQEFNISDVSLHVSNRPMFYHSGNMSMVGLSPKQRGRFSVTEGIIKGDNSHISILMIRVKIINATREDAGTFICEVRQNSEKQDKLTKKIALQVEFPPGRATCEIENSFGEMNGVWLRVNCRAPVGSIQGYIDCYQEGEKMPPWTRPVQDRTNVKQTLWIKRANPVHCCTSNYERPTDRCSCNDFGWDPVTGSIPQNKIDPCQITQVEPNSEPTSTKSQESHSSASNKPLPLTTKGSTTASFIRVEGHKNNISIDGGTLGVLVAAICVLLVIIVLLILYVCTLRKKELKGILEDKVHMKAKDSTNTQGKRDHKTSESETEDTGLIDKNIPTKAYAEELKAESAQAKKVKSKFATKRATKTVV